ncbi:anti-sigma factor domain-containing protein [Sphingomonas sp. MMS24-J45]|uniref:anti-sigma factor n=1 Tax=Sphingomonas sp. MMS24-J45 TaxID=3238806 RepID=UPI0038508760
MSDLPPVDPPHGEETPDMAAAELALGLLEGEERAAAIRRVLAEPGFARSVERWRDHLAQLFDLWPAVEAPDLFDRIERSLDRAPDAPVAVLTPTPRPPSKLWPALAGVSSLVAAVLLVVLIARPVPVPPAPQPRQSAPVVTAPAPTLVASIDPTEAGSAPATAVFDAQAGAIRVTQAKLVAADRSAELWVIPADGTPHSLGVLRERGSTALTLSPENRARIAAGAVLAVTVEPIGGSPTGLPTGPVVAKGALAPV